MGLDVVYYERFTLLDPQPTEEEAKELQSLVEFGDCDYQLLVEQPFMESFGKVLQSGKWYKRGDRTGSFRAGSYIYYSRFREFLWSTVSPVAIDSLWASPQDYAGKPFVLLCNFSDCDGVIGPDTAKILAGEFAQHKTEFHRKAAEADPYFAEVYDNFLNAFMVASDGGLVAFC